MKSNIKKLLNNFPRIKKLIKKAIGIERNQKTIDYLENKFIYGYIQQLEQRVLSLENLNNIKGARFQLIEAGSQPKPTLHNPVSQAVTAAQLIEPQFYNWCEKINLPPIKHRKRWEYVYILRCLELHGKISKGNKGVGFGVGLEPVVPYLSMQGVHTVATDLDYETALEKGWVGTNQFAPRLKEYTTYGLASLSQLKKTTKLQSVDMNRIPFELKQGQFDFTWSACALEHLGSIENGLTFVKQSLDCLRPGGIAVHTTELNVSSNDETIDEGGTVIFRKKDFEILADELQKAGHKIELSFNLGQEVLDRYYDIPPYSEYNHLKLALDNYYTTSYGLMIEKR